MDGIYEQTGLQQHKMKLHRIFLLSLFAAVWSGCKNSNKTSDTALSSAGAGVFGAGIVETTVETDTTVIIPRVDATTLHVSNLHVGNFENKGVQKEVLSFSVDPRTTYITYKICPLEVTQKECPKNQLCAKGGECWEQVTLFDRVELSYVGGGKIKVSAQACIDAERALTDETCGPAEEIFYDSARYEGKLADLLATREYLYSRFRNYALQLRGVMDTFMHDAKGELANKDTGCLQGNADAYKALQAKVDAVDMYLAAPLEDAMDALKNDTGGVGSAVLGGLSTTWSQINKGLQKFCEAMATATDSNKTCIVLQAIGSVAKQFAYMMLPKNMLSALVTAIKDFEDPSASRRCTSSDIFNQKFLAINQVQQSLYNQIQQINTQLKNYGY